MTERGSATLYAPRQARRLLLLSGPLAFAGLTLLHPHDDPHELGDAVGRWLVVHALQLVLSVLLAYSIWILLDGLAGRAASIARAALPVFLVFSAFDAVAGLSTGWLARDAHNHPKGDQDVINDAIVELFHGNWLTGNLSVAGAVTAFAWLAVALGAAVALRRAGADRLTVAAMAGASLFASHPPPFGTIGLLALAVAAYRWDRHLRLRRSAVAAISGATHPEEGQRP